jgi:hypothetical protein
MAGLLGCPGLDEPDPVPRVAETPTPTPTPTPVPRPTAAAPRATATATPEPAATRDPRGSRCEMCSNDAECRPPLRCFPFTDGRSRCDTVNPGPPC